MSIIGVEVVGLTSKPVIVARRLAYRYRAQIASVGAEAVWLGSQGVTPGTGFRLGPLDGPLTLNIDDEVWGVTGSRTYAGSINAPPVAVVIASETVRDLAELGKATP